MAEMYIQWATILSQTLWVCLHSFIRCCLQKSQNHAQFR